MPCWIKDWFNFFTLLPQPNPDARAVNMLGCGKSNTDIKIRLGHENINSTMVYLHMDLTHKRSVQKKFIQYTQSTLKHDPKLDELIDWDHKEDILAWLDSL